MKVYIVNYGCDSEREVIAVFSSPKNADEYAEKFSDCHVEEYEIDTPENLDLLEEKRGLKYFKVVMKRNGEVAIGYGLTYPRQGSEYGLYENRILYSNSWARDEQHAIKIANERRAMLIANGEWKE